MPIYYISGIWKNSNEVITHYALHIANTNSINRAEKVTKAQAIIIVSNPANKVITWIWNYKHSFWESGESVHIVNGSSGKYLRSDPDSKLTDNLAHLIDYDWIFS
ncbi:DUF3892 domain-containing protein [Chitinophaga caseinilytica]|uniref:DUF3892 domain-containing protein n=1 Tax=Chitinophaga caseinilytica TaxID=2267521 RepID=UPI003CC5DE3A